MAFGTKPPPAREGNPINAAHYDLLMDWSDQGRYNRLVSPGNPIEARQVRVERLNGNRIIGTYTSFGAPGLPITAAEFNRILNYYG